MKAQNNSGHVMHLLPRLEVGGVERQVLDITKALVSHGWQSTVVCAHGRLVSELKAAGGRHIDLEIGKKSLRNLCRRADLIEILASEKPDILHAHSRLPAWVALWALKSKKLPQKPHFVTSFHSFYSAGLYSSCMARGETVTAVSQAVADYAVKHWPKQLVKPPAVIYSGVDLSGYASLPAKSTQPTQHVAEKGRKQILIVGRVVRNKGADMLPALVAELLVLLGRERMPVIVVAGSLGRSAYMNRLQAGLQAVHGDEFVRFLGPVDDVPALLATSTALMSLSLREGFGKTIVEALAADRPTLAWKHTGLQEVMDRVQPWGLVPFGDIPAMAQKIAALLDGVRPPIDADALQDFDVGKTAAAYLDLYRATWGRSQ